MSIEIMYPSRTQSRAQNPLFAREFRRQKLCVMLALAAIGLGLLLVQFVPITAHADDAAHPAQPAAATTPIQTVPIQADLPAGKTVRQIQIYATPAR